MARATTLLVLMLAAPALAEPDGLESIYHATVVERGTRRPILGATVTVGEAVGVSAADGTVEIEGVAAGSHELSVIAGGFRPLHDTVILEPRQRLEEVLRLEPEGVGNPYETVVRAERPREEVARRSLGREELRSVPGTFGDPLRAILNLPGIARAPFALGVLLVRGTGPDDSAVFVDGHEVPAIYHFLGGPSVLNADVLERIDYYPGSFGARFGRAIGGAIDVGTHPGDATGWHGDAEVDLIDTSLFAEGPLFGFTVTAAARRSYVDAILPAFLPDSEDGASVAVVPVYWDLQLRVDRKLGARNRISFLVFGSDDKLDVASSDPDAARDVELDAHVGFWRAQATWKTEIARGVTSVFSPQIGYDLLTLDAGTGTSVELGFASYRAREDLSFRLSPAVELRAGLDLEHLAETVTAMVPVLPNYRTLNAPCSHGGGGEADGNREVNDSGDLGDNERVDRDLTYTNLGAWAEAVLEIPGGLKLIPGLRFERYSYAEVDPFVVDPRLTLRYSLDDKTTFKTALGMYHQPAPPQFLDAEFGNPRLDPERSEQYAAGFERVLAESLTLDVQAFYSSRSDLVVLSEDVTIADALERELFSNDGEGRSYGLEVLVRHEPTRRLYGWISYTLSRSEMQTSPQRPAKPFFFDQTHNLIVVASYRLDGGWELGTRFRLVSGRPETPILGSTFDADSGGYCAETGQPGDQRGPLFTQLDLRIEKTWTFDLWRFSAYLDVQNVYNAQNPEATLHDYRFRDHAPLPGLPILPTLGIRGRF
ncbi:MAG: TonB-dependent receptor [Deltaproteobacteria bacterium]|nr:TonB-dependent receptor [Deltaproteobacteria bacterium]